jgi:serine/threonine protein kinase
MPLALKTMLVGASDAEFVERFRREARAFAKIGGEHVVRVIDADTAPELGGAPFLVMELLNGSDLSRMLEAEGRLSPDLVVKYLTQTGAAIERAHAAGLIHRDLKPENIFVHQRETRE